MAKRGGYRAPSGGPRVSGPGAASQRSDANQPVNVGRVGDSEDLTHGDRQKLEEAVRQRPLSRAPQPQIARAEPEPSGRSMGSSGGGVLPDYLMALPTTRPGEPETTGLPMGPGAGPEVLTQPPRDDREVVLQWLASQPNAPQAIVDMQNDIRNSRMAPAPQRAPIVRERITDAPLPNETEPLDEEVVAEEGPPQDVAEEPSPIEPVPGDIEEDVV